MEMDYITRGFYRFQGSNSWIKSGNEVYGTHQARGLG